MLDEYAEAFSDYLRTGTVDALSSFCAGNADLRRLGVYRNGFLKGCVEALRASYPSVDRLVGAERFPALARPYVDAYPPRSANLAEYGGGFPRFIDEAREQHQLGWLASFAALDRAWSEVYFAPDATEAAQPTADRPHAGAPGGAVPFPEPGGQPFPEPPSGSDCARPGAIPLGSGDAEALMSLRGRLAPWALLVSLDYCALDAWSRLREDGLHRQVEVPRATQIVLIWRSGADVLYRELEQSEHRFIAGIAAGRPCGEAAGDALEIDPEFDLANSFASLLHHRVLFFEH